MATGGACNGATTTGWRAPTRFDPSGRTLLEHARASAERVIACLRRARP
jgi:hypothetical protein